MAKKKLTDFRPGQHAHSIRTTISKSVIWRFLLYLPEGYGRKKKLWPLILFLHGAGERGEDIELVKKHGPPKLVEEWDDFPFIVLSPQCSKQEWWSPDDLIALLDEVIGRYSVDPDRVYLTGLSMGGYGTWALAVKYPDRFAAIAPICGGGNPLLVSRIKHIPAWVFHGARDETVPLQESERMVKALKAAGGKVKFTVYPDAGHDSWTETYKNPALYKWFLRHRRKAKG